MNRRYITLLTAGHFFTDINQGALPAILPFLVLDQGMSYTAAAGLVFAANAASAVIQPLFGFWADRLSKTLDYTFRRIFLRLWLGYCRFTRELYDDFPGCCFKWNRHSRFSSGGGPNG